jgi:hypothetical protein
MKSADNKSTVTASNNSKPFFTKDGEVQATNEERSYFPSSKKKSGGIQAKLSIGKPNDHYEKEADAMADKVVQKLDNRAPKLQQKAISPVGPVTPIGQNNIKTAPPAEEKLQKKDEKEVPDNEEKLQKKPIFESRSDSSDDDDKNVQRKEDGDGEAIQSKPDSATASQATPAIESSLNSSKGSGNPLPAHTRSEMESSFDSDFSSVRIHDNSKAAHLSKELNAQAFTHGNDIYFNSGKYDTSSSSGKHLLAHELTHTIQQSGRVQKMIQKNEEGKGGGVEGGKIEYSPKKITLPKINLPQAKKRADNTLLTGPFERKKKYKRADSYLDKANESSSKEQREVWKLAVEGDVKKAMDAKVAEAKTANAYDAASDAYYFKHKDNPKFKMIGTPASMAEMAVIPNWTRGGKGSAFDVDHVKELQLGGRNFHDNMELLNFSLNRGSGSSVKDEIKNKLEAFIAQEKKNTAKKAEEATSPTDPAATPKDPLPKDSDDAKSNFDIQFDTPSFDNKPHAKGDDHYWSLADIKAGKQIAEFSPMDAPEIKKVQGEKGKEVIYTSPIGGVGITKDDIAEFNKKGDHVKFSIEPFPDQSKKKPGELVHSFEADFSMYGSGKTHRKVDIPIYQMPGIIFGGHIPRKGQKGKGGLEQILVGLDMEGLSPMIVEGADLVPGKGFQVKGKIQPTLEFLKGFDLDFYLDGNDFGVSRTFTAEELKEKIPKPFKINSASLTIGAGTNGIFLEGDVQFEIDKLGTGSISGYGKSSGDFGVKGHFDFDKKLFKPKGKGKGNGASIDVEWNNKEGWKIGGTLEIGENTVKGIKSGKINVLYANNTLEAAGTAEVTIKGVKEVTLRIKFAEGVSEIEGGVKIEKLPGIKDGEGTLKVVKKGEEYDFSGSGKITPDIPGLTSQLAFEFHNDIFLVDAKIAFEKGRLKGDLNVGITNRAIDPVTSQPTGEALPDYKVYGSSELSLKITDNITVTAGVKLLENGEIEVKGGIKLPPKIEVVPKLFSVVNKPIIEIPEISFPLFGIPLGVTTLGLEATIAPYIKADAQIGPGYLANTQAEVIYNPSHPDELSVTGSADFEFIAEASLHAGVDFGIGISIGIAAAKGGINLDAYIKVAAKQPIFHADIKYSPATGFELEGNVKAIVAAILGFSGNLFLSLRAGVWPLKKTWRWDKPLFKKEIDTGLEIGFEFPFSYKNGQANLSFDNLKFVYPKFDGTFIKTLSDKLIKPVVDDLL